MTQKADGPHSIVEMLYGPTSSAQFLADARVYAVTGTPARVRCRDGAFFVLLMSVRVKIGRITGQPGHLTSVPLKFAQLGVTLTGRRHHENEDRLGASRLRKNKLGRA